jgi:RhtB (resistance to homoserine/threonine) family protein
MLMNVLATYGVFVLALIAPGPDFVIVVQNSVRNGVRAGMWTSLGIALALMLHVSYIKIGLGELVAHSMLAFNVLKYAAAAYLLYIGIKGLRSRPVAADAALPVAVAALTNRAALLQGFMTNALNPKAVILFLSLLTIMLDPAMAPQWFAVFVLALVLTAFIWFSLVAYFLSREPVRQGFNRCGHWFDRVMGALLIGLGIKVALASR